MEFSGEFVKSEGVYSSFCLFDYNRHCVDVYLLYNQEVSRMMPHPEPYLCPSPLETLIRIDQLFVHKDQTLDEVVAEACCGIRSNNRYVVKDEAGNKVLDICEENECCTRQCCGPARSFIMCVMNNSNHEVIRLVRPYVCNCCQNELEVQSPPGIAIGNVRQNWHIGRPNFTVENEQGQPVFKIVGPICTCCTDENYELMSMNGAVIDRSVGKIFKPFTYSGPNAAADFVLKFPSRLEVKLKAVILGACILIDCMYYEKK